MSQNRSPSKTSTTAMRGNFRMDDYQTLEQIIAEAKEAKGKSFPEREEGNNAISMLDQIGKYR